MIYGLDSRFYTLHKEFEIFHSQKASGYTPFFIDCDKSTKNVIDATILCLYLPKAWQRQQICWKKSTFYKLPCALAHSLKKLFILHCLWIFQQCQRCKFSVGVFRPRFSSHLSIFIIYGFLQLTPVVMYSYIKYVQFSFNRRATVDS